MKISEPFKPVTHTIRLSPFYYTSFSGPWKKKIHVRLTACTSRCRKSYVHSSTSSIHELRTALRISQQKTNSAKKQKRDTEAVSRSERFVMRIPLLFKAPQNLSLQRITPEQIGRRLIALREDDDLCKGKQLKGILRRTSEYVMC